MTRYSGSLKCSMSVNLPMMETAGDDLSMEVLEAHRLNTTILFRDNYLHDNAVSFVPINTVKKKKSQIDYKCRE